MWYQAFPVFAFQWDPPCQKYTHISTQFRFLHQARYQERKTVEKREGFQSHPPTTLAGSSWDFLVEGSCFWEQPSSGTAKAPQPYLWRGKRLSTFYTLPCSYHWGKNIITSSMAGNLHCSCPRLLGNRHLRSAFFFFFSPSFDLKKNQADKLPLWKQQQVAQVAGCKQLNKTWSEWGFTWPTPLLTVEVKKPSDEKGLKKAQS